MIHIPDHLVGFYNISHLIRHTEKATPKPVETTTPINPAERGPLPYISGYVVFKLEIRVRNNPSPVSQNYLV